jgi:hypothetical protein
MKITFDIDATPQELRTFFGLPDIEPLQNEMLELIRKNMVMGTEGFEAATLMKPFLPETITAMQKTFWQAMLGQKPMDSDKAE